MPGLVPTDPVDEVSETTQAALAIGTDALDLGDLADLQLTVGELTSTATRLADGTPDGTFAIEDLQVLLGGSLVDDVIAQIDEAVAPVLDQLSTLGGLLGVDPAIENPLSGPLAISDQDLLEAASVESFTELPAGTDLVPLLLDAILGLLASATDDLVDQVEAAVAELRGSPQFGAVCRPPLLPPNPLCELLDTVAATVAATLADVLETLSETVLATLQDTLAQLLELSVGTKTLSDDGTFGITALSAVLGPDGLLGQLDLATSTLTP